MNESDLFSEAQNLVNLLSQERATNYHLWYDVGQCLFDIDARFLVLWTNFSKKNPEKYDQDECEKLWKQMVKSNYTIATLHFFASKDHPDQYADWINKQIAKFIEKNLFDMTYSKVAKLVMMKYRYQFRCASVKHNTWFVFKNHKWTEMDANHSLGNLISDELVNDFGKYQTRLYELSKQKQGFEKEHFLDEAVYVSRMNKQLNNRTFKNSVIRECADLAYENNFFKNLDESKNLICFENGVYDLKRNYFRDGCPDDYITLCTNYCYVPYCENNVSEKINEFLELIMPDKETREYVMKLLSLSISGYTDIAMLTVFEDDGQNGAMELLTLFKYALGEFFKDMDPKLLMKNSNSDYLAAMCDKKGIRSSLFNGMNHTHELNTDFLKLFSGGDLIRGQTLQREPVYFLPQLKPILLCKSLPKIYSDDDGFWRRCKIIKFMNELDNNYRSNLNSELIKWRQTFMTMLIHYYAKYQKEGLLMPKTIVKHTLEYKNTCAKRMRI